MGSSSFLNGLLNFPKDNINGEMVELLQPYLQMEDFNLETAKKVRWSQFCSPFLFNFAFEFSAPYM